MKERGFKKYLLDILFPKFCFRCQREGSYLCQDCLATLEIIDGNFCLCDKPQRIINAGKCPKCRGKILDGLYFATSYKNNLVKNLIFKFKYPPYVKELAETLSSLIITHFNLIQKDFAVENYILVPVPLAKKKLRSRGFNQSEELAKEISKNINIPLILNCLIKTKETQPQMELSKQEREGNIKGVFEITNAEKIKNKKILLVDDVYTTGATMEECAKILKKSGVQKVFGVVVAREEL
jgi:ComF family protein